jgi:uncharacterized membrane protein
MFGSEVMVVFIAVGIPVVCVTLIILEGMKRKDQRRRMKMEGSVRNDRESEIIEEIYRGIKSLRTRIENLETIYQEKRNRE